MSTFDELPLWLRTTLTVYPWRRIDPVPCAALSKPVAEARVALVTTAGLVPDGQPPFDESIKGGDYSSATTAFNDPIAAWTTNPAQGKSIPSVTASVLS